VRNPILYGAVAGIGFSLLKHFQGVELPKALDTLVSMFADCVLGTALFNIGLFAHGRPLLNCGRAQAGVGCLVRFICSPVVAALVGLALRLRGDLYQLFILQAALPQAVVSFAIATEYKTYPGIFSTLVVITTVASLPVLFLVFFITEQFG